MHTEYAYHAWKSGYYGKRQIEEQQTKNKFFLRDAECRMTYLMNDKISALEGEEFQRKKIHKRPNPLHMNVYH